jgi:hypothetical protein
MCRISPVRVDGLAPAISPHHRPRVGVGSFAARRRIVGRLRRHGIFARAARAAK